MIEKKWFAVCTRTAWGKRVTESLAKRRIEHYWPVNRIQKDFSERRKAICEPLFTSFVFVNLNEEDKQAVIQIPGVINFVYWLGQPAVIRNEEIVTIRQFLNEYPQARIEKTQVDLSDKVRFIGGPLITRKGNLLEVKNYDVKVVLPSLGYAIMSEARKELSEEINSVAVMEDQSLKVRI
jgi:transcription antitermination factor NusG